MLKRIPSQIKDQSLRQMYFLVAPYEIILNQTDINIYTLQLEKGYQIIGSLKNHIQNTLNTQKIILKFYQNAIKFRLFSEKNVQYQWALYKRVDLIDEIIQTKKFNLKQTFKKQNKTVSFQQEIIFDQTKIRLKFYIFRASSGQQLQIMVLNKRKSLNLYDDDFPLSQIGNKKSAKTIKFIRSESQDSIKFGQKTKQTNKNAQIKQKQINKNLQMKQKQSKQIIQHNSFIEQAKIIQQQCQQYLQKNIIETQNINININKQFERFSLTQNQDKTNTQQNQFVLINKQQEQDNKDYQISPIQNQAIQNQQYKNNFIQQPLKLKDIIDQNLHLDYVLGQFQCEIKKQQVQENYHQQQQKHNSQNNMQEQMFSQKQNPHLITQSQNNQQSIKQTNLQQKLPKEQGQQLNFINSLSEENRHIKQQGLSSESQQNVISTQKLISSYSLKTKTLILVFILILVYLVYSLTFLGNEKIIKKQKNKPLKSLKAKITKTKN